MARERCSKPLSGSSVRGVLATALLALALSSPLAATGEYLVQDLGQRVLLPPLYFPALQHVSIGGVDFTFFDDGIHGLELWRSDGTALGTYMVRDACPGVCGSEGFRSSQALAAVGSQLLFAANDGVHGTELWVSDGTAGGAHQLADLRPGPSSSDPDALTPVGGLLYFVADDGVHGRDLWRSDGTEAGTFRVFATEPYALVPGVLSIAPGMGQLYLETDFGQLWRTDGTAAGTWLLVDRGAYIVRGWMKGAPFRTLPNGVLLFVACDTAHGCELWRSDGTVAGTSLVVDLVPGSGGSFPGSFYRVGVEIWFSAQVPNPTGFRSALFRTDGTTAGTVEIALPAGAEARTFLGLAEVVGSRLFFAGEDADHGTELWVTDGMTSEMVADLRPGPESSLFSNPNYDRPWFAELAGDLLFLADDGTNGWQLWRTDGTAQGTEPLSDFGGLPPDAFFGFYQPLAGLPTVGGRLLFPIWRYDTGVELWASDGSAADTRRIAVVSRQTSATPHGSTTYWTYPEFQCLAPLRQGVVFAALDAADALTADLVFADGVPGGASSLGLVWDYSTLAPECVSNANEILVASGLAGTESLWRTRGALPGLEPLRDFPGNPGPSTRPLFHRFDGAVFLGIGASVLRVDPGIDPSQILELPTALWWGSMASSLSTLFLGGADLEVTDGLEFPAVLLPDPPGPDWIQADDMTVSGDRLFFSLDSPAEGPELWTSDATVEGTKLVTILQPGPVGGLERRSTFDYWGNRVPESRIAALAPGHVVFAGDDGTSGNELWASDGTEAGTVLIADLDPGPDGSWPRHLTSLGNGVVLFAAEDPALGLELYRTNGTTEGAWLVRDIVPGAGSSVPDDFSVQDGVLYFSAWTPANGRELWRSNGTYAGTYRLTDLAPGPLSSSPSKFTRAGNRLFFLANDNVHGFELWARADDGSIPLFIDGFETGDTTRWSAATP